MSPWTVMRDSPLIRGNFSRGDMLDVDTGLYWSSKVVKGIAAAGMPYLKAFSAPDDWLHGVNKVIKHILISAGMQKSFATQSSAMRR